MRLGARRRSNRGILFPLKKLYKIPIEISPNNDNIYLRYYGNTIERFISIITAGIADSSAAITKSSAANGKRYRIPGSIAVI